MYMHLQSSPTSLTTFNLKRQPKSEQLSFLVITIIFKKCLIHLNINQILGAQFKKSAAHKTSENGNESADCKTHLTIGILLEK